MLEQVPSVTEWSVVKSVDLFHVDAVRVVSRDARAGIYVAHPMVAMELGTWCAEVACVGEGG